MKVLITGIAGHIGQTVALRLLADGHRVWGIDRRPWDDAPEGVTMHAGDIRKRAAEEVFRKARPEAVVHMATVTHLTSRSEDRYRINMLGTRAVFEHSHSYGAKHVVFVGRHTYYGASSDSPLYHVEDEPPMAVSTFPELADLVAADLYAGSALWRFPDIATSVLRFCYTLGDSGQGTLANYLMGPRVPTVMGFDPLFQFMHEEDVARAIACALEKDLRGVFNVAGPQPVPLSLLIRETGRQNLPLPEPIFRAALGRFGFPKLPRAAVGHIKYPVVVDAARFGRATGFSPAHDEDDVMHAYRTFRQREAPC